MVRAVIDERLLGLLECPRDRSALHLREGRLCCAKGHSYSIIGGIPVFLLDERQQTIGVAAASLKAAESGTGGPLFIDTLGLSEIEKRGIERDWSAGNRIDSVISYLVGATSGWGYVDTIGRIVSYPIPNIPVGEGNGELLLDIGSNWGRWSVSAARKGWRVIGIDPSLGALMAARRAFSNMGLDISFVCGDARFLPFKSGVFQCGFSYSVIQHFAEPDAELVIEELGRVLRTGGLAKIQMAHKGGLRSTYIRTRRDYVDSGIFRVRYWPLEAMSDLFDKAVGPTTLVAEAFGGLGLLAEDRNHVNVKAKILITVSQLLKKIASFIPLLMRLSDSVYVVSIKRDDQTSV